MIQALKGKFNNKGIVHMQALTKLQELFQLNATEASRVEVEPTVHTPRLEPYMITQPVHVPQSKMTTPSPPTIATILAKSIL